MVLSSLCVIILINPLVAQHVRIYHEIMDDPTGWTLWNDGGDAPVMPYTNTNCVNTPSCCMLPFPWGSASKIFSTTGYHNIYVKFSVRADGTTYSTPAMDALWLELYPDANFNDNMETNWLPNTFNTDQFDPPLNATFYPSPNANYIDDKPNMKLEWGLGSTVSSVYRVYLSHLEIYGIPISVNDPTNGPTNDPTNGPTPIPTTNPTNDPTHIPTVNPTLIPTFNPTHIPTTNPTNDPTHIPTYNPTHIPTVNPTTSNPTNVPTPNPTIYPTQNPSNAPTHIASGSVLATATNVTTFRSQNGHSNASNNKAFIWILISILSLIVCINIICAALYFKKKRKRLLMSRNVTSLTTLGRETMEDTNIENIKGENNDSVENECGIELEAVNGENEAEISEESGEDLYSNIYKTNVEMITTNYKSTIKDESETDGTANKTAYDVVTNDVYRNANV